MESLSPIIVSAAGGGILGQSCPKCWAALGRKVLSAVYSAVLAAVCLA